jgi:hypothetical protein
MNTMKSASQSEKRPRDAAVELVSPSLRLSVLATLFITMGVVGWACFARIPIYVNGVAYLLELGAIKNIPALTEGEVYYQFSATTLVDTQLFRRLYRLTRGTSTVNEAELTTVARELLETHPSGPKVSVSNPYAGLIPAGQVLAWINSPMERISLREKLLTFEQSQRSLISEQSELRRQNNKFNRKIKILRNQLADESTYLSAITDLREEGYASKVNVLAQRNRVIDIEASILSEQQALATNQQRLFESQTNLRIAFESLRREFDQIVNRCFIFADRPLYIVDLIIPQGDTVKSQHDVLNYSTQKPGIMMSLIPGYLDISDADQVAPGMSALVTPVGMERAQFGGIMGSVIDVSPTASTRDQIADRVGSLAVAEQVSTMIQDPIRVNLELKRDTSSREPNHGGYRWSSSSTPPYALRKGIQLNLQITTQRVRPISLLIPSLLKLSGVSPPNIPPQHVRQVLNSP